MALRYELPGATVDYALTGATPSSTYFITLKKVVTGGLDTVAVARTSTGVIEDPAGSGIYTGTVALPTGEADYYALWDNGGTPIRDDDITRITADPTPFTSPSPLGSDLTTVEKVKLYLGISDASQDDLLQDLISRASVALMNYAGREFAPNSTATTRNFYYTGDGFLSLSPYDLRTATTITWDPSGDATVLVADDDYSLGAATMNSLYDGLTLTGWNDAGTVRILGDWGFTSVPLDVEHAAILTVATWRSQIGGAFRSSFFSDPEVASTEALQPYAGGIPAAARRILDPYMRIAIG